MVWKPAATPQAFVSAGVGQNAAERCAEIGVSAEFAGGSKANQNR
ncbi:Uncharacterised protein [Klebsiella oxytoca]|nr:Uncharacterised protein [Klebsiella oxytoca]